MNQAVMIGAGVRTSAESWELNVCVSPPFCVWQGGGEHVHETCLDLSLLFICNFRTHGAVTGWQERWEVTV